MANEDGERERRQYRLMEERLAGFRTGQIGLGRLVNDLEALLYALEQAPDEWKDRFISAWGGLEITYAVALDRLLPIPDATDPVLADDLLDLAALVEERLKAA